MNCNKSNNQITTIIRVAIIPSVEVVLVQLGWSIFTLHTMEEVPLNCVKPVEFSSKVAWTVTLAGASKVKKTDGNYKPRALDDKLGSPWLINIWSRSLMTRRSSSFAATLTPLETSFLRSYSGPPLKRLTYLRWQVAQVDLNLNGHL